MRHKVMALLQPASNIGRPVIETLAGLICGVPLGVSLYYIVAMAYYPVLFSMLLMGLAAGSVFHIPNASVQVFLHGLDYGPVIDVVLAALAIVSSFYFTRGIIRQGYRVFAWVQLPLMLPMALILFYLTLMDHKPLFPFYEQ